MIAVSHGRRCVAALVCVHDYEARELPKRLTREFHHHDRSQATRRVDLDKTSCVGATVLKGRGLHSGALRSPIDLTER